MALGLAEPGTMLLLGRNRFAFGLPQAGGFLLERAEHLAGLGDEAALAHEILLELSARPLSSRSRSAARSASRSRFSPSILRRPSAAPRAASSSRKGCSASPSEASSRSAFASVSVAAARAASALARFDSSVCTRRLRLGPRKMEEQRLGSADLLREVLVAPRLARLALQAFDLRLELADDVGRDARGCSRRL